MDVAAATSASILALAALTVAASGCGDEASPMPAPDLAQPSDWDAELRLPEAADVDPSPGVVEIHLEARVEQLEILPGRTTAAWTYDGSVPGPLIRARKGDRLIVHFTNRLPAPTTVHWHGIQLPASMDGTTEVQGAVPPGGSFTYDFHLRDPGLYWYHPHVDSSAQVGYGLYGAVLVEDPSEPWLGDDLVLVLSDMSLDEEGALSPGDHQGSFGDYFGREGRTLLVNGKLAPRVKARVGVPQRWRVLNASRARYHKLRVPGQELLSVGGDGGLAERARFVEDVTVVPGERAELRILPREQDDGAVVVPWMDANRYDLPPIALLPDEDLIHFEVTSEPPGSGAPDVPDSLRSIVAIDTTDAPVRSIELMEKAAPDGGVVLGINGMTSAEWEPFHVQAGTTEIWELTNTTPYHHPFHLHGFFFQVLSVDGEPPPVLRWQDTVNIRKDETIRVAIHFDDRPGMWMFHCHILDHAELGMMGMFMVM